MFISRPNFLDILRLIYYSLCIQPGNRLPVCVDTSIPLVSVQELLTFLYADEKPILLLDSLTIVKVRDVLHIDSLFRRFIMFMLAQDEVLEDIKIDTEIIPFEVSFS